MERLLAGAFSLLVLTGFAGPANATTFFWSYFGTDELVGGSGALNADLVAGAAYRVISVNGFRNGVPVVGPAIDYAGADDLTFKNLKKPRLDTFGLAFGDVKGDAFKIYYDVSIPLDPYACRPLGQAGYCELGPGVPQTSGVGDLRRPIQFFLWWEDLPEPDTWAVMLAMILFMAHATKGRGAPYLNKTLTASVRKCAIMLQARSRRQT